MADDAPVFQSTPIPAGARVLQVSWEPDPEAEAYIYCRLTVAVGPEGSTALLAGGLDLMMERYVVAGNVTRLCESSPRAGHRLVLVRTKGQRLRAVEGCKLEAVEAAAEPTLDRCGPPVDSWLAGQRVGTPPPAGPVMAPRGGSVRSRSFIEEPNTAPAKRAPAFIEKPMTIREGVSRAAVLKAAEEARKNKPTTPLQAWEMKVKPRQEKRSPAPTTKPSPPPAVDTPPVEVVEEDGDVALRWVLVGSDLLLRTPGLARPALRKLRGWFQVGFTGMADRAKLQRRADQLEVPLDGIFAMDPDHPNLAAAIGCRIQAVAVLVTEAEDTPPGARRVETTPEGLSDAVAALVVEAEAS